MKKLRAIFFKTDSLPRTLSFTPFIPSNPYAHDIGRPAENHPITGSA